MTGFVEYTAAEYLESKTTLADRVAAIDTMIDKAILLMVDTIDGAGGNVSMYELDDGQVRIKTTYRSIQDVEDGIKALERMRNMYLNRLRGRVTVLQDKSTFKGSGGWGFNGYY